MSEAPALGATPGDVEDAFELDAKREAEEQLDTQAMELLKSGNLMRRIYDEYHKLHPGDDHLFMCLLTALGTSMCLNTDGMGVMANGGSGTGKTHSMKSFIHVTTGRKNVFDGTMSDKALFYKQGLSDGLIVLLDDVSNTLSPDMTKTVKLSSSNYQDPYVHETVDNVGKKGMKSNRELMLPRRIVWLLTSVDNGFEDQLVNRAFSVGTQEDDKGHMAEIAEFIRQRYARGRKSMPENKELDMVRRAVNMLREKPVTVSADFDFKFLVNDNTRNETMFMDTICASVAFNQYAREHFLEDGVEYVIANPEDFKFAVKLWGGIVKGQVSKLTKAELLVKSSIEKLMALHPDGVDANGIADDIKQSVQNVRFVLNGRRKPDGTMSDGLLAKDKGIRTTNTSTDEDGKDGKRRVNCTLYYCNSKMSLLDWSGFVEMGDQLAKDVETARDLLDLIPVPTAAAPAPVPVVKSEAVSDDPLASRIYNLLEATDEMTVEGLADKMKMHADDIKRAVVPLLEAEKITFDSMTKKYGVV